MSRYIKNHNKNIQYKERENNGEVRKWVIFR